MRSDAHPAGLFNGSAGSVHENSRARSVLWRDARSDRICSLRPTLRMCLFGRSLITIKRVTTQHGLGGPSRFTAATTRGVSISKSTGQFERDSTP